MTELGARFALRLSHRPQHLAAGCVPEKDATTYIRSTRRVPGRRHHTAVGGKNVIVPSSGPVGPVPLDRAPQFARPSVPDKNLVRPCEPPDRSAVVGVRDPGLAEVAGERAELLP